MDDPDSKTTISSRPLKSKKTLVLKASHLLGMIIAIIILAIGFWLGTVYQKHHSSSSSSSTANTFSGLNRGGNGFGHRAYGGGFGTVSAISSTSITVTLASGSSKTYAITSSTTIDQSGQAISYSSIQIGEKVIVVPSSTNAADAANIIVPPGYNSGLASPGDSSTNQ